MKLIQKFKENKEIFLYLFFGVCTTLVNILSYYALRHYIELSITVATVISWIVSVLFAYITNKLFVFESRKFELRALTVELGVFISGRLFTGVLDLVIMLVFVDVLNFNEHIMKILSNILVVILNYILSKVLVFKNK